MEKELTEDLRGKTLRFREEEGEIKEGQIIGIDYTTRSVTVEWYDGYPNTKVQINSAAIVEFA